VAALAGAVWHSRPVSCPADDAADAADEGWPRGRGRHGGVDEIPVPGTVGRMWLAGRRYVAPDPEAALASVRATTVVCLCEAFELEARWPEYVRWLGGPSAVWCPVPDLHAPPAATAGALVREIATRLDAGAGVLVHCGAGMGRAGTVAAAVLMHYGMSVPDAVAAVAAARPGAGPEVGAQTELLEELAGAGRYHRG
jgi:protein-tyrosine phosphatase